MNNFIIFEENIDVNPYLKVISDNISDWSGDVVVPDIKGITKIVSCIPLTLAVKPNEELDIDDIEEQRNTIYYEKYKIFPEFAYSRGFKNHGRMGIFKLNPNQMNAEHSENGVYYDKRHRYHFSISGEYDITVGNDVHRIVPGMFFWFDNKLPHSAKNVGKTVRISLVFDALKTIEYKPPA